jgi:hypothetical protein
MPLRAWTEIPCPALTATEPRLVISCVPGLAGTPLPGPR